MQTVIETHHSTQASMPTRQHCSSSTIFLLALPACARIPATLAHHTATDQFPRKEKFTPFACVLRVCSHFWRRLRRTPNFRLPGLRGAHTALQSTGPEGRLLSSHQSPPPFVVSPTFGLAVFFFASTSAESQTVTRGYSSLTHTHTHTAKHTRLYEQRQ